MEFQRKNLILSLLHGISVKNYFFTSGQGILVKSYNFEFATGNFSKEI